MLCSICQAVNLSQIHFHPYDICIVLLMVPSSLYKTVAWHAPATHVAPISPVDMDAACDTAEASDSYLADLPLQRPSRTRRGWQMVKDGFWSPPPGDVSAGCRIGTPCTWTAWGGEAAHAPALRCHGNLLCSETRVHLFGRWGKKRGKVDVGASDDNNKALPSNLLLHINLNNHMLERNKK